MSDELIEAMARVLYECDPYCNHDPLRHKEFEWEVVPFERAPEWHLNHARERARAILPVIRAHLEPNERMAEAGAIEAQKPAGWHSVYRNIWRAMLAASPIGDVG